MSFKHLRTLVAIADHRTFTAAADSLRLTHAAVSQHVSALESEAGVPLFDRSRRTPTLNATGQAMVQRARRLLRDYDDLLPSVLGADRSSGELVLGTVPTVLTGLGPKAIRQLRVSCPGLRLEIRPGLTAALITELQRSRIGAAIVTRPLMLPDTLRYRHIADEPLMLVTAPGHDDQDPLAVLSRQPFIRFNRDAVVGAQIEDWLQSRRIRVNEAMELASLDAILSMVHANIGVSIVPRPCVAPFNPPDLRWVPLDDSTPSRGLGLVQRRNAPNSWAIDAVLDACRAAVDSADG